MKQTMKQTPRRKKNRGCKVRKDLRLAIYLRDRFTCLYCGKDLHNAKPEDLTLDHLKCQCEGGPNDPTNLVTSCKKCNSTRGKIPWKTYAPGGAIERILRNRRRSIKPYRILAQDLMKEE